MGDNDRIGWVKWRSIAVLLLAELMAISLWFVSAAILPDMLRDVSLSPLHQAGLSSAVQLGFVCGALISAFWGLADRLDPRHLFAGSAIAAASTNAILLIIDPANLWAVAVRFATGMLLAGVYPVGMKIAAGWGTKDRGLLVGSLVGALTVGSAMPYLMAFLGGVQWRLTLIGASIAALLSGFLILFSRTGPYQARASAFDPASLSLAWTDHRIRLAFAGYLGHMWELYAMWAWISVAATVSFAASLPLAQAASIAKLLTFFAIAVGGITSVAAGMVADRVGKANVAIAAMIVSGAAALATGFTFGGPVWVTCVLVLIWGAAIVPDSAQFSALVADAAPAERAGSLMTLQTALGFSLTFATVQFVPFVVAAFGWPATLALMALGPALGIVAMLKHKRLAQGAAP